MQPIRVFAALAAACLLGAPLAAGGSEVYVDAISGDDLTGTGTALAPYRTITKGISAAGTGATVHIAPGAYNLTLGESFPLSMKGFMTLQGSGAHHTIISGEGSGILILMGERALISDVTIMRGDIGVRSFNTFFNDFRYLRRCIVRDNDIGLNPEDFIHTDAGFAMVDCSIVDNQIAIHHDSPDNDFQSTTILLYGTTVTSNGVALDFDGWGERYLGMVDSIVWGNLDDSLADYTSFVPGITGCVLGDPTYVGMDGNIGVDPAFVVPLFSKDHHLTGTSPVIDNPAPDPVWPPPAAWVSSGLWIWEPTFEEIGDLDGNPRSAGTHIDPGCDEYLAPTLYSWGRPDLGEDVGLRAQADPFDALLLFASQAVLPAPVLGFVWLQPPYASLGTLVANAEGIASSLATVPADPSLAGLDLYFQAIRAVGGWFDGTDPEWLRLLP